MASPVVQTLWLQHIGEPESAVWCPHCLKPSAHRQRVAITLIPLEQPYDPDAANGELVWCQDCGRILSSKRDGDDPPNPPNCTCEWDGE